MRIPALLYSRTLPGGGFVAIEAIEVAGANGAPFHASVSVERRTDPSRRLGHAPPVIAEAHGANPGQLLETLYPIAVDNVAVAHHIQLWQARQRPEG